MATVSELDRNCCRLSQGTDRIYAPACSPGYAVRRCRPRTYIRAVRPIPPSWDASPLPPVGRHRDVASRPLPVGCGIHPSRVGLDSRRLVIKVLSSSLLRLVRTTMTSNTFSDKQALDTVCYGELNILCSISDRRRGMSLGLRWGAPCRACCIEQNLVLTTGWRTPEGDSRCR